MALSQPHGQQANAATIRQAQTRDLFPEYSNNHIMIAALANKYTMFLQMVAFFAKAADCSAALNRSSITTAGFDSG